MRPLATRLVFVAALVAMAVGCASPTPSPIASPGPSASLASSPAPTPPPTPGLARYDSGDFAFEYPATWGVLSGYQHAGLHGPTVYAAVGIGGFDLGCRATGPSGSVGSGVSCGQPVWTVPDDGVVLAYHVRPWLPVLPSSAPPSLRPGEEWTTVGGQPAARSDRSGSIVWRLGVGGGTMEPGLIEAHFGTATTAVERAEVEAIVGSWRWDDATSLTPSPSPEVAITTLEVPFPDDSAGRSLQLAIVDRSDLVQSVRAATGPELALAALGEDGVGVAGIPAEGYELLVAWFGVVCDLTATLTISTAVTNLTIEEGPAPGCDLVPVPRGVVLRLAAPRTAETTTVKLVRNLPIEAIARSQAEAAALGYWGPSASVTGVRFARAADLDPRLSPPDRAVWAIAIDSGELPGSCPSPGPGVDPFTDPPCRAAASATMFLDAATGTYLGVGYGSP